MYEKEIAQYEALRTEYVARVASRTAEQDLLLRHEVLFAAHSCAIEGNSFTVGDTQELKEKGLGLIPQGKTLLEVFEILDHFKAYEYMLSVAGEPLSEGIVKEFHRLMTQNTLAYRVPGAVPGEYTTSDMCAGDTIFGDHEQLIARVPALIAATQEAIDRALAAEQPDEMLHPVVIAARFHGFFEYLHPFRDGNGRVGRLLSNLILHKMRHPMIVIDSARRPAYLGALNMIRTEKTDEHLIHFFFDCATQHMAAALQDKAEGTRRFTLPFLF